MSTPTESFSLNGEHAGIQAQCLSPTWPLIFWASWKICTPSPLSDREPWMTCGWKTCSTLHAAREDAGPWTPILPQDYWNTIHGNGWMKLRTHLQSNDWHYFEPELSATATQMTKMSLVRQTCRTLWNVKNFHVIHCFKNFINNLYRWQRCRSENIPYSRTIISISWVLIIWFPFIITFDPHTLMAK